MKKATIAGGGVLGTQIAFQCAYKGLDTTIWLRSPSSITRTQPKLDQVYQAFLKDIDLAEKNPALLAPGISDPEHFDPEKARQQAKAAYESLKLELDLAKAVQGSDIVIEAMSEDPQAKTAFYEQLAPVLDPDTILVTNSSTLLPSQFAEVSGRPDKFMALHFANHIWRNNLAEAMAQPQTDQKVFEEVMDFARQIGMDPVPVRKEKNGYLLNSMMVPFLNAAMDLYVTGVSDPASIDEAWKKGTGAPLGPFQILDIVGLPTAYNIVKQYVNIPEEIAPYHFRQIADQLKKMIDAGEHFYPAG